MIAPKIMSPIDTNRIPTKMLCMTLVFSILLKAKTAPETKKRASQKKKEPSKVTSASILDRTLPVIMHFEMATPNK